MSSEAESLAVAVGWVGFARVWVDQARQRLALEPVPVPVREPLALADEPERLAWGWWGQVYKSEDGIGSARG